MKSALPLAALLLAFAGGYLAGRGCAGDDSALLALRDSLTVARAGHARTDSLLAAAQAADSLRRAEDDRRVATSRDTAVVLGAAVSPLLEAMRTADSAARDSLLTQAQATMAAHLVADSLARVDEDTRHRNDSLRIVQLNRDLLTVQAQRDEAQDRADEAVRLGLARRPGHGWKTDAVIVGVAVVGTVLLR